MSAATDTDRLPEEHEVLAFGAFELDVTAATLRRAGARVKLRGQPRRLLELLARSGDATVTREAIREHLWEPGTHVNFARSINACVKDLRAVLRDDAQAPRFIETVPGVGYRFVAPVEVRGRESPADGLPAGDLHPAPPPSHDPPAHDSPADDSPAHDSPADDSPADGPPTGVSPTGASLVDDSPPHDPPDQPDPRQPPLGDPPAESEDVLVDDASASSEVRVHRAGAPGLPVRPARGAAGRWARVGLGVGLLLGIATVGWVLGTTTREPAPSVTTTETSSDDAPSSAEPPSSEVDPRSASLRLVVLPFVEVGVGEQRPPLADALQWELIAALNRRHPTRLEVIAMHSAQRSSPQPDQLEQVQRSLDADHVLRGTLVHGEDRLRLSFSLVRARDGAVQWSDVRDVQPRDLAALHAAVSDDVVHALALELPPRPVEPAARETTPEAYQAYLRGRLALVQPDSAAQCPRALEDLDEALRLDPSLAVAHAARARALRRCGGATAHEQIPQARAAARRALELDPRNVEAHVVMARIAFFYDFDPAAARRWIEGALEFDPGNAEAHHALATQYIAAGRYDDSRRSLERAFALDPLSTVVFLDFGWFAYFGRRYEQARVDCEAALERSSYRNGAHECLVRVALAQGRPARAQQYLRAHVAPWVPKEDLEAFDRAHPESSFVQFTGWLKDRIQARPPDQFPEWRAKIHLMAGDPLPALAALELAYEQRQGWLIPFLEVDPLMDPLREHQRFQALVRRARAPSP